MPFQEYDIKNNEELLNKTFDIFNLYNSEFSFPELMYYEPAFENKTIYKEAVGTGYKDMVIILEEESYNESVFNALNKLYPNNIQQSKYAYNHDKTIMNYKIKSILSLILYVFIFILIVCFLMFVVQRTYYRNKIYEYAILLGLGYSKIKLLGMLFVEAIIDFILVFVILIFIFKIIEQLIMKSILNYEFSLLIPTLIGTFIFMIIFITLLNIIYVVVNIKYNYLNKFLN